jgi:hypothetical protein
VSLVTFTYDLEMKMQSAEWHTASPRPKKSRLVKSKEKVMLIAFFDNDSVLTKIVTGDESWVFTYYPETKMQSAEWHTASSLPKKSCLIKSKEKVMLIAFFDIDSVVHHEFVPPGHTVNGHFYMQVLQRLRDALRRKRHDKWQREWFLHHDKALSHTSLVVQQFSPRKAFLSSPNHRILRILLRVTRCSLL